MGLLKQMEGWRLASSKCPKLLAPLSCDAVLAVAAVAFVALANAGVARAGRPQPRILLSSTQTATIIISVVVGLLVVALFALGIKMLLDRTKAASSDDADAAAKATTTTTITTPRSLSSGRMKPRKGAVHVVGGTDDDEDAEIPRARAEKWSLADVAEATAQFAQERVIEAEGQSVVLRGSARDGRDVAVKRCKQPQPETQAIFLREVMLLTTHRHPNLLPLVGYCDEGTEQILIFEHMKHGSLASWLRPPVDAAESRPPLTFEQRVRIAADVARAVEFLHSQPKPIVHKDIKTETILLDDNFNAKLGGLGTRKHLPGESSRVRVQRRKGYLDPEYCQTFVVTAKAEIFAVGVVILELITGRPPVVEEEVVAKAGRNTVKIVTLAQWKSLFHRGKIKSRALPPQKPPLVQAGRHGDPEARRWAAESPNQRTSTLVGPSQTASFGSQGGTPGSVQIAATLLQFSYNELFEATNGFSREGKLGEGGFGSVHKGRVHVGGGRMEEVAVKALNQEGYQGEAEWVTEVKYLGALGHPNLVRLVGYCMEGEHRLLAYELMEYGSLERYLFRRNVTPLPWNIRMKVALHAARGLAYLHEETEAQVIYRDFKASNILVDREFNAKLSDFGLAKDGPVGSDTHVSTRVMGTYGYAAPEYMLTVLLEAPPKPPFYLLLPLTPTFPPPSPLLLSGHLTAKSDVYSFGVVLLEIISGRRAVERNFPPGQQNIVEWSAPFFADRRMLVKIVDQRLENQFSVKGVVKAARLAYNCLKKDPKERPLMSDAVQTLSVLQNLTDFPPPLPAVPPAPSAPSAPSASPPSAAAAAQAGI
ncbi:unnamed protein product [Closterium sp. Yama58-4]|nr:unnamed protein product [Closterium sp. Yama58-4]